MYKLYRQKNGQVKQVLVEPSDIPPAPPQSREDLNLNFPNPLNAKGQDVEPTFLEQEERQFDLIKQNESQQAKFQTKKLQWSNYQILNFQIKPTDSVTSQAYYNAEYNTATAVGTAMTDGVMFGTGIKNSDDAKYYNIVYADVRFSTAIGNNVEFIRPPSYVEFYPMQKVVGGVFGGKIPRQVEAVRDKTNLDTLSVGGTEFGVQSMGLNIYNQNTYYAQSKDLRGVRCIGLALKQIQINFDVSVTLDDIRLDFEIGYDLRTEGNNY